MYLAYLILFEGGADFVQGSTSTYKHCVVNFPSFWGENPGAALLVRVWEKVDRLYLDSGAVELQKEVAQQTRLDLPPSSSITPPSRRCVPFCWPPCRQRPPTPPPLLAHNPQLALRC